jgi:ABC-type transporter Mla MlaB component
VERIGTAGMQVLLSIGILCEKMNKSCEIEMPSSSLLDAFEQLGCINIVKRLGMIS